MFHSQFISTVAVELNTVTSLTTRYAIVTDLTTCWYINRSGTVEGAK